jgi:hypothetical protein
MTMATKKQKGVSDAGMQRLNIRLGADAYRKLHVHALMARTTVGALIEQLALDHCRSWSIRANAANGRGHVTPEDRLDPVGDVSSAGASAA